jgi:hypothetical protein
VPERPVLVADEREDRGDDVAIVTETSSPSPAPECSALAPTMVRTEREPPTTPNLAASCISTLNRA